MKKFFIFLLFILTTISVGISLYLYFPYIKNQKTTTNKIPTATISSNTSILSSNESVNSTFKIIHVPLINQFPELPSGCEIVATTMLLKWYGYKVDKRKILDTAPIVSLGVTKVRVELYKGVIATINCEVKGKE